MQNRSEKKRTVGYVLVIFLLGVALSGAGGCSGPHEEKQSEAGRTVRLVYVDRAEAVALTHLAKVILENRMGYKVNTVMTGVDEAFSSVADGRNDGFLDAWLPVTQKMYMDKYGDDLVNLGPNYKGARIGLVVPDFVTIESIEQLNGYREGFATKIIGIEWDAGIMGATNKAIKTYGLDYVLLPSSDPSMAASLDSAFIDNLWVVVTGWRPHWMWARWKLKFLDDPKKVYGEEENINTVVTKTIPARIPEVTLFLRNFYLTDAQLTSLMADVEKNPHDPGQGVRIWISNHEAVVTGWLPGKQPVAFHRPDPQKPGTVADPSPKARPEQRDRLPRPVAEKMP